MPAHNPNETERVDPSFISIDFVHHHVDITDIVPLILTPPQKKEWESAKERHRDSLAIQSTSNPLLTPSRQMAAEAGSSSSTKGKKTAFSVCKKQDEAQKDRIRQKNSIRMPLAYQNVANEWEETLALLAFQ